MLLPFRERLSRPGVGPRHTYCNRWRGSGPGRSFGISAFPRAPGSPCRSGPPGTAAPRSRALCGSPRWTDRPGRPVRDAPPLPRLSGRSRAHRGTGRPGLGASTVGGVPGRGWSNANSPARTPRTKARHSSRVQPITAPSGWWLCRTATRPLPSPDGPASTHAAPPFPLNVLTCHATPARSWSESLCGVGSLVTTPASANQDKGRTAHSRPPLVSSHPGGGQRDRGGSRASRRRGVRYRTCLRHRDRDSCGNGPTGNAGKTVPRHHRHRRTRTVVGSTFSGADCKQRVTRRTRQTKVSSFNFLIYPGRVPWFPPSPRRRTPLGAFPDRCGSPARGNR